MDGQATPPTGENVSRLQDAGEQMISRHGFLGVPAETFADAGRRQFVALLNEGLNPESKVLDLGCGCLRTGCWLIRFLDRGSYHAIEPARERVEYGLEYLFFGSEITLKQPRFEFRSDFDSSGFGVSFDFFLAGSIWSHASKGQIQTSMDAFDRDSTAATESEYSGAVLSQTAGYMTPSSLASLLDGR